jgi:ribosomal protein S18 acetylase RimI-like enzyme
MDDLTIRLATCADMQRLIDIMYDDPPGDMRAIEPDVRKAKAVGALVMRAGLDVDVRRTAVAVADARAVGLLEVKHPGDRPYASSAFANGKVLVRGLPIVGLGGLVRYFRYQKARARVQIEYPPDSYYVRELDVDPGYRNRGIGARLLEHGEVEAREMGVSRMSLCTGITNPAQHLYERAGFRIVETRRHADYERITGNPGRVLMVKELG